MAAVFLFGVFWKRTTPLAANMALTLGTVFSLSLIHISYNERENIENINRAVFALKHVFHILVIEEGSPDGTAAIVKIWQQEFPERLFMVERKGKLALGTAYIAGFKWALQRGYEYIFEMDADFSVYLPR